MTNQIAGPAGPDAPSPQPDPLAVRTLMRMPGVKAGIIAGLLLLMQIPLAMVNGLIGERVARQAEVLADFQRGWGPEQTVAPPGGRSWRRRTCMSRCSCGRSSAGADCSMRRCTRRS